VDKNIFAPIIGFNETKSFAIIKKFHSSCGLATQYWTNL
jgi:hypothetical protein